MVKSRLHELPPGPSTNGPADVIVERPLASDGPTVNEVPWQVVPNLPVAVLLRPNTPGSGAEHELTFSPPPPHDGQMARTETVTGVFWSGPKEVFVMLTVAGKVSPTVRKEPESGTAAAPTAARAGVAGSRTADMADTAANKASEARRPR